GHPWMVGSQFHPEFRSRPGKPHPLFRGFIAACLSRQQPPSGTQPPSLASGLNADL
ncbi:MAG: hypothetical protein GEU73_15270, partial [Chloroflexi bacterium]|nr:hypothetical protein [Chloroflexota bacterium]